jgi:hypothetical protein
MLVLWRSIMIDLLTTEDFLSADLRGCFNFIASPSPYWPATEPAALPSVIGVPREARFP